MSRASLHGDYVINAGPQRGKAMPRAIHVRLSEEAMKALVNASKGKGKAVGPPIMYTDDGEAQVCAKLLVS